MVNFAAKVGVFSLALILSAVPTMACLLPTATLTAAEHECCKRMARQCGRAGMPSSHSCCQRLSGPEDSFIKASKAQLDHVDSTAGASSVTVPLLLTPIPLVETSFDAFGVHGPPGSPPVTISILRI